MSEMAAPLAEPDAGATRERSRGQRMPSRSALVALPIVAALPVVMFAVVDVVLFDREQRRAVERQLVHYARGAVQAGDLILTSRVAMLQSLTASLKTLIEEALAPHMAADRGRVSIAGPEVILPPKPALALSLVMHELATNALKYGALSSAAGRVAISWQPCEPESICLEWQELGGPSVGAPLLSQPVAAEALRKAIAALLPPGPLQGGTGRSSRGKPPGCGSAQRRWKRSVRGCPSWASASMPSPSAGTR